PRIDQPLLSRPSHCQKALGNRGLDSAMTIIFSMFENFLNVFKKNSLHAKLLKCKFHNLSFQCLGFIVSMDGISMDPTICQKLMDWPQTKIVRTLQLFLGFANIYHKFMKNYSKTIGVQIFEKGFYYSFYPGSFHCPHYFPVFFFEYSSPCGFQIKPLPYLLSLSEPFEVPTDHNYLKYCMSFKWFQMLFHVKKMFTPRGGKPSPKITLIIFKLSSPL
ncbi:uncharacterized protein VP01_4689g3, partial [Puccinia sorghi]